MNHLAWGLLIAPAPLRDPARAAALARDSLEGTGVESDALNTLGAACYRLGDYPQAVRHLLRSRRLMTEKERPYNDFFLAMTYARLGERPLAEMYFRKALEPLGRRPPAQTDLAAIHHEAVETLGGAPGARPRSH
jgi:Flp pilus assembly protein TadD